MIPVRIWWCADCGALYAPIAEGWAHREHYQCGPCKCVLEPSPWIMFAADPSVQELLEEGEALEQEILQSLERMEKRL